MWRQKLNFQNTCSSCWRTSYGCNIDFTSIRPLKVFSNSYTCNTSMISTYLVIWTFFVSSVKFHIHLPLIKRSNYIALLILKTDPFLTSRYINIFKKCYMVICRFFLFHKIKLSQVFNFFKGKMLLHVFTFHLLNNV